MPYINYNTWLCTNAGIVDAPTDSLFTYQPGESWATYYDPCFVPVYTVVFSNPALQSQANAICGGDQQCLFDVAATGQVEIGQSTRDIGLEYEEIMQIQIPGDVNIILSWGDEMRYYFYYCSRVRPSMWFWSVCGQ